MIPITALYATDIGGKVCRRVENNTADVGIMLHSDFGTVYGKD